MRLPFPSKRKLFYFVMTVVIYVVTGKAGLIFAVPPGLATPVWPPSGIALAAVLLFGEGLLPAIAIGSFLLNASVIAQSGGTPLLTNLFHSSIIAFGSVLQAAVGLRLLGKRSSPYEFFNTGRQTFIFVLSEMVACLVASTIGTIQIKFIDPSSPFFVNWLNWYLGDLNGVLIFSPLLLLFLKPQAEEIPFRAVGPVEKIGFTTLLVGAIWFVFGTGSAYHASYLLTVFVLWAAFRFRARWVALTMLVITIVSVYFTSLDPGTFGHHSPWESLLSCQAFLGVLSVAGLMVRSALNERSIMEASLRKSESNYRAVFELSSIGKCQVEFNSGKIIEANERFAQISGYDCASLAGMNLSDLKDFSTSETPLFEKAVFESENRTSHRCEARLRRKNGEVIDVELNIFLLKPARSVDPHIIFAAQEITERKHIEEERNLLTKNLERANQELQTFTYGASHDLKEPLRTISSHLALYKRSMKANGHEGQAGDETLLDYAIDAAKRMSTLVDSLMLYGKVDSLRTDMRPFELDTVVGRVTADLQFAMSESKANIRWNNLPEIVGNPTLICQLLENLISNAIKFRGPRPLEIEVNAWLRGEHWLFCVRDNGIGLDMQHAKTIFLPFKRLHSSADYAGSGLGLATCRKIVNLHGGTMWVESVPGSGAEFFFTIPQKQQKITPIHRSQAT